MTCVFIVVVVLPKLVYRWIFDWFWVQHVVCAHEWINTQ